MFFFSWTFYPTVNYDYHLDWNQKKCWRKTYNHHFRPLKLFPAWFSRISIVFYGNFALWHIWQILQWVLVILWKLNQIFDVSLIKLFLKIVALEKIWVTSKTNGWQQNTNWQVNWHGNDVIFIKNFTKPSEKLKYRTNIFWNIFLLCYLFKILANNIG